MSTKDFLSDILEAKKRQIEAAKAAVPLSTLQAKAAKREPARGFAKTLRKEGTRVIAEIKRASPSKGNINAGLEPILLARRYEEGGAAALSVLTEPDFFKGSLRDYEAARTVVAIPVLRKDFIIDEYQVWESAAHNADAILLIIRIIDQSLARRLLRLALSLQMDVLIECYSEHDADRIPDLLEGIPEEEITNRIVVGANNRDLSSFRTDTSRASEIAARLPKNLCFAALSGVRGVQDIREMESTGISRFLVGETLVRAENPQELLQDWISHAALSIKICGITLPETAQLCVERGAGAVGCVFYAKSPRVITPESASEIFAELPDYVAKVGVFVDMPFADVIKTAQRAGLTTIQFHGKETIAEMGKARARGYRVIKAAKSVEEANSLPPEIGVLLECSKGSLPGGNGLGWKWITAREINRKRFAIAGGLSEETLAPSARLSLATAFDVSSGVELALGIKDPEKINALLTAAHHLTSFDENFWRNEK